MKTVTRAQLERRGWAVADAQTFLGLSDEELAFIDLKLALADHLRRRRVGEEPDGRTRT